MRIKLVTHAVLLFFYAYPLAASPNDPPGGGGVGIKIGFGGGQKPSVSGNGSGPSGGGSNRGSWGGDRPANEISKSAGGEGSGGGSSSGTDRGSASDSGGGGKEKSRESGSNNGGHDLGFGGRGQGGHEGGPNERGRGERSSKDSLGSIEAIDNFLREEGRKALTDFSNMPCELTAVGTEDDGFISSIFGMGKSMASGAGQGFIQIPEDLGHLSKSLRSAVQDYRDQDRDPAAKARHEARKSALIEILGIIEVMMPDARQELEISLTEPERMSVRNALRAKIISKAINSYGDDLGTLASLLRDGSPQERVDLVGGLFGFTVGGGVFQVATASVASAATKGAKNVLFGESVAFAGGGTLERAAAKAAKAVYVESLTKEAMSLIASGKIPGKSLNRELFRARHGSYKGTNISFAEEVMHARSIAVKQRYSDEGLGGQYFAFDRETMFAEMEYWEVDLTTKDVRSELVNFDNLLDLTDPEVRTALGVSLEDITREGGERMYQLTQQIGDLVEKYYNGIIYPSARSSGSNVVIFKK
jgi:hypothetical protein